MRRASPSFMSGAAGSAASAAAWLACVPPRFLVRLGAPAAMGSNGSAAAAAALRASGAAAWQPAPRVSKQRQRRQRPQT